MYKIRQFDLAVKRIAKEQDLQHLIEMNRISRLMHKMNFLARQRDSIKYSSRFVITDNDLAIEKTGKIGKKKQISDEFEAERLLKDFDPFNDAIDRRILKEVLDIRLDANEFRDSGTSDSEEVPILLNPESSQDSDNQLS